MYTVQKTVLSTTAWPRLQHEVYLYACTTLYGGMQVQRQACQPQGPAWSQPTAHQQSVLSTTFAPSPHTHSQIHLSTAHLVDMVAGIGAAGCCMTKQEADACFHAGAQQKQRPAARRGGDHVHNRSDADRQLRLGLQLTGRVLQQQGIMDGCRAVDEAALLQLDVKLSSGDALSHRSRQAQQLGVRTLAPQEHCPSALPCPTPLISILTMTTCTP